jgi:hypothetical protein
MKRPQAFAAIMAGFVSLAVASASILIPINGAAEEIAEDERPNSLRPGSWAVQFEITDELGLIPFDDMIVSLKRHLTRSTALRLGMHFGFSYRDETREYEASGAPVATSDRTSEQNTQSLLLKPAWIHYFNPGSTFNLFAGTGPLFSYSRTRSETKYANHDLDSYQRVWGIGLFGIGGAEWFITKTISLHMEYCLSGAFYRRYQEESRTYFSEDDYDYDRQVMRGDEWRFDGVDVMLGLSFYF